MSTKDWPRFNLGVGVPKSSSQTDAWDVLPHLSDDILDHVSAIFLAPQQLEAGHGHHRTVTIVIAIIAIVAVVLSIGHDSRVWARAYIFEQAKAFLMEFSCLFHLFVTV